MNEHKSFITLTIISDRQARNSKSGAIVVRGGVGVGDNIFVENEINSDELIVRNNSRIGNNLYINGDLFVNKLFVNDDKKNIIHIKKNIYPIDDNLNFGNDNMRWNNIFCSKIDAINSKIINLSGTNLDITNEISLGSNINNEPLIRIDKEGIIIESNLMLNNKEKKTILDFDYKKDYLFTNNFNTNFISIEPQIFIVDNSDLLKIKKSLIFLKIYNNQNLLLSKDGIPNNSLIKIIVKESTIKNLNVNLQLNTLEKIQFKNVNDYIEIYYNNYEITYIGGNIRP